MSNGKKKSKKKIIVFSVLGVLILTIIALIIFGGNKEEIIIVQTGKVERRTIVQTVKATGKIQPEFKVVITPEVSGEIVELPVKEGDKVKKGQLLLKIKQDQYIAQRDRAAANLASIRSNLVIQKVQLKKIESDYKRIQELHSKGLSSDVELETIRTNFETATAQVQSAEAAVKQSEAALKEANEQLYKTTIFSPMDGVVSQLNVKLGERVLGTGFSQGTNMMTVADLSKMETVVDVDENDVVLISKGDTAIVEIDAYPEKKFTGIVYEIGNTAKQKGLGTQEEVVNFEVKIRIINLDVPLKPGMSANAEIQTETRVNVLAVPIQSVTARSETNRNKDDEKPSEEHNNLKNGKPKEVVFVVDGAKAKMVEVKTGISDDNYIEIIKGLNQGDEIITGNYKAISKDLQDGSKIRIDNPKNKFLDNKDKKK